MSILTQTQQQIIANLTNEFKSLNITPTQPLNELMDIGALLSELNNDKKQRKEIELSNDAYILKLKETATNYSIQLCDLFKEANIVAWVKHHSNSSTIYIGTWYEFQNKYIYETFHVDVNAKSQTTYFKSNAPCINEYIDGHNLSFYFDGYHKESDMNSLEELLSNKFFISRIKKIIVSANRETHINNTKKTNHEHNFKSY